MPADAESVRKRLAAMLRSDDFHATLAAIYLEKGDDQIPYPKEVYSSSKYVPAVVPSGEVDLSRSVRLNPDDYSSDTRHEFDIYWHNQGIEEERIQTELERLVRAVEDYFRECTNLLPLEGCQVWTGDADWSPILKFSESGPLVKSAVIQVFVRAQR